MRTCKTKKRKRRLGNQVHLNQDDEISKLKKKLKVLQKRSLKRLRDCRELETAIALLYDETEEQSTKIKNQEKDIQEKDETIQKLRKK